MSDLLISSDSHVLEPSDLWTKGLPASMRSRAPRVFFNEQRNVWMFGCEEVTPQPITFSFVAGVDLDNLPEPMDLAEEIIENIEAGLNSFRTVAASLAGKA